MKISHIIGSDQTAAPLFFLLDDRFDLFLDDHAHGFIEDIFESFLGQGTTFHVLALKLFLNDLSGGLFHDGRLLGVLFYHRMLFSKIDFVSYKYLRDIADVLLQLGVPLCYHFFTFLRAFTKDEGSTTEKTMIKTSQFG